MKYKLADGRTVDGPETLTPEEAAWLKDQGGQPVGATLGGVVKNTIGGLAEGALRAPFIGGDLFALGATGLEKVLPGSTSAQNRRSLSDDVVQAVSDLPGVLNYASGGKFSDAQPLTLPMPENRAERYANSIGNGVGGLVLGGAGAFKGPVSLAQGAGPLRHIAGAVASSPVLPAGAIGAAGEFAGDVSRGFDDSEKQNPFARFAGSASAALLAALKGHLGKAPAARPLHEVFEGQSPAAFREAQAETERLARAGATQNTVGDSFPPSSRVAAMEREVSNEMGAGQLGQKLAGRTTGDIPRLEAASRADIQKAVVPGVAPPPGTVNAAEWVMQQARNQRSNATREILGAAPLVPREQLAAVIARLRTAQMQPQNRGTLDAGYLGNAARTIAGAPQYPLAGPIPAPGRMAGATPVTPTNGAGMPVSTPGTVIPLPSPTVPQLQAPVQTGPLRESAGALGPRIFEPERFGLGARPASGYRPAGAPPDISTVTPRMQEPRIPTGANLEALAKLVKSLDTMGAKVEGPTAGVFKARGAIEAKNLANRALRDVNPAFDAAMESHASMSPGVNALSVLAENPNALGPTASNTVREALAAHLSQLDAGLAARVAERRHAADTLAGNTAQHGIQGLQAELGRTPMAELVAPVSSAREALKGAARRTANAQIAGLLANPTPANYATLQALARNNPDLARTLVRQGLMGGVSATTQTEGSAP